MHDPQAASVYTEALLAKAKEQDAIERVRRDLGMIRLVMKEQPDLKRVLFSPHVAPQEKIHLLTEALQPYVLPVTLEFLKLLIQWRRIELVDEVIALFEQRADEIQGMVEARVRTAVPLAQQAMRRLEEILARLTGKQVVLNVEIVPELVGGLSVIIGHRMIDGSIRGFLAQLRERLMQVKV